VANPRIIDRYFSWTLWGAFSRRRLLVTGDIADQDTDAVVTAAHWRLNKGAGTDEHDSHERRAKDLRRMPQDRWMSRLETR